MTAEGWNLVPLRKFGIEIKKNIRPLPGVEYEMYSVPAFSSGGPEVLLGEEIKSAKRNVQSGDLLLCKINPRINRVWWVDGSRTGRPQLASSEYLVLRLHEEHRPLLQYLVWYLRSPQFRRWIELNVEGATGSHTRAKSPAILEQPVPLAPQDDRVRIVEEIEKQFTRLDAASSSLRHALARLNSYRSALIAAALSGQLTGGPGRWAEKKLGEIGNLDRGSPNIVLGTIPRCSGASIHSFRQVTCGVQTSS